MPKSNDEIVFGKFFYPKSSTAKKWAKTISQRGKIKAEVQRLEWHKTEGGLKGPMSQTLALQAITDDIGGTVIAVAWNGVINDRYALLGVRRVFNNPEDDKDVRPHVIEETYWIDESVTGCVAGIASKMTARQVANMAPAWWIEKHKYEHLVEFVQGALI